MRHHRTLATGLSLLLLTAAAAPKLGELSLDLVIWATTPAPPPHPPAPSPIRHPGDLHESGCLILTMLGGDRGVPVLLADQDSDPVDYGILIVAKYPRRPGGKPRPLYIIGDRRKRAIFTTADPAAFSRALRVLPRRVVLYRCDGTCAAPLHYGLSREILDDAETRVTLSGHGLREGYSTCTCELTQ